MIDSFFNFPSQVRLSLGSDWLWRREGCGSMASFSFRYFPILCVSDLENSFFIIDGYCRYFYATSHNIKCLFSCVSSFGEQSLGLFLQHQYYSNRFDLRDVSAVFFVLKERGMRCEQILSFWSQLSLPLHFDRHGVDVLLFFYKEREVAFPFLKWGFSMMEVKELLSWERSVYDFLLQIFQFYDFTFSHKRNIVRLFRHVPLADVSGLLLKLNEFLCHVEEGVSAKKMYDLLFTLMSSMIFPHYTEVKSLLDELKSLLSSSPCRILSRPGYESGVLSLALELSCFSDLNHVFEVLSQHQKKVENIINVL